MAYAFPLLWAKRPERAPRLHYPIRANSDAVGEVVSGTQSPSLNLGIGMGYLPPLFAKAGTKIEIEIRGKRAAAEVVPKPIYRKAASASVPRLCTFAESCVATAFHSGLSNLSFFASE